MTTGHLKPSLGSQPPKTSAYAQRLREKVDVVEPAEAYEQIASGRRIYARTFETRLLDILLSKELPRTRVAWVVVVWRNLVNIWNIPHPSPLEYLSIDRVRGTLKIADEVVTRIVVYEPVSDILLIIQPLQSIKLEELRKMIYRRPRIPVTRKKVIEILRAYTSSLEDIDYPVRVEP